MQQKVVHVLIYFLLGFMVRNRHPKLMAFSRVVISYILIKMILRQKLVINFHSWYVNPNMTAVVAPNIWLSPYDGH